MLELTLFDWFILISLCVASALVSASILKLGISRQTYPEIHNSVALGWQSIANLRARAQSAPPGTGKILEETPYPIWTEDLNGTVLWANPSY